LSQLVVTAVENTREMHTFLTFPWEVFKYDPLWIPPLLPDLRERTDPNRGIFFHHGEAEFFIAWQDGKPVGTICAAIDMEANQIRLVKECIFGFFHFVEDYAVFEALLRRARDWAVNKGLNILSGPFNLDYEDGYGVLIEGRDRPPTLMCGHSPAYYASFYNKFGFQALRGDNIAFALELITSNPALEELRRMADRIRAKGRFNIRSADLAHWEDEIEKVYQLLNTSLAHLPDFRPWPREVVFNSLAPFRKIADPDLILFAEENGKTIGWLPGLPNMNEIFTHVNGLRYPWNYLSLLIHMNDKPKCLAVKSVLIPPEYWGNGAVILLFDEMIQRARERGYQWIDASLTSADNPRTPALGARLGATLYKRYRVYTIRI
jgi:hypothetical protein